MSYYLRISKVTLEDGSEVSYSSIKVNKQPCHKLVKDCCGHYLLLNMYVGIAYEIAYQTCVDLDLL